VITLPFVLLLLDYWPLRRLEFGEAETGKAGGKLGRLVAEKIPLFLMALVVGSITFQLHRSEGAMAGAMPLSWRLKNVIYSYVAYLGKIAWPTRLAVFYPHPENSLSWGVVGLAALALLLISVEIWRYRAKKYLVVGWLWYLGVLLPMSGIVQSGRQGIADRYVCGSLLGLFIGIVWLIADWAKELGWKREALVGAFVIVLVPLGYLTHVQIGYWRNSTLFGHTLDVTWKRHRGRELRQRAGRGRRDAASHAAYGKSGATGARRVHAALRPGSAAAEAEPVERSRAAILDGARAVRRPAGESTGT
jgi:hypothetical protein